MNKLVVMLIVSIPFHLHFPWFWTIAGALCQVLLIAWAGEGVNFQSTLMTKQSLLRKRDVLTLMSHDGLGVVELLLPRHHTLKSIFIVWSNILTWKNCWHSQKRYIELKKAYNIFYRSIRRSYLGDFSVSSLPLVFLFCILLSSHVQMWYFVLQGEKKKNPPRIYLFRPRLIIWTPNKQNSLPIMGTDVQQLHSDPSGVSYLYYCRSSHNSPFPEGSYHKPLKFSPSRIRTGPNWTTSSDTGWNWGTSLNY